MTGWDFPKLVDRIFGRPADYRSWSHHPALSVGTERSGTLPSGTTLRTENPIIYYIDPATPKKWIPYLKAGVEDWNTAFEAAGFKNAIIAKEWPNDPNMSLDDARYSVIRYLPSETENAYGPRIVDPRSGEIMESHICWYHNVMNLLKKWYMVQCGPLDKRARTMTFDDKLMGSLIQFVSSHEVGHSIGLRHNMAASSATPVEKLRDKAWVEANGHTVSIMDYARFNYVAQPEDRISEKGLFPRIGVYDKWAIQWGYRYRPEFKDPYKEKDVLRAEVTKNCGEIIACGLLVMKERDLIPVARVRTWATII